MTGKGGLPVNKRTAICEYLRRNHIGKANAVHSRELEGLFGLSGRSLRTIIGQLRQDGVPVCSDGTGYYYADNQKEINATVRRLNEFVTNVSNARTGLLYSTVLTGEGMTVEINISMN